MVTEKLVCTSCKAIITNLGGSTKFQCPNCGKSTIVRCKHCRDIAAKYKCASCGFEGPN